MHPSRPQRMQDWLWLSVPSEYVMGLCTSASDHEQGPPLVCDPTDDSNTVAALGPRPSFQSGNGCVFFTLFVLLCWLLTLLFRHKWCKWA